jgi:membrane-associated phospholipid phosphatase
VLAAAGRYHRLQEFTMAFALALIVTTTVSGLVPAVGAYEQVGIHMPALADLAARPFLDETRSLFDQVRDGTLRQLNILGLAGLVTFPSFHAASAVLYAWALWPVRWIRPFVILANGAMLASTPIDGGHYFIDLAAGMAVAAGAIVAARAVSHRLARHRGSTRMPSRMNAPAAIACQPNA